MIALGGFSLILFDRPIAGFVVLIGEIAALILAFQGKPRGGKAERSEGASDAPTTE